MTFGSLRHRHHRHTRPQMLTILLASIYLCSLASAFVFASYRKCHGTSRATSLSAQREFLGGFQSSCDGALLWCNVMAFVASVIISPSPSMASTQQTYPVSDVSSTVTELGLKPATETKPQITLKGKIEYDQSLNRGTPHKVDRNIILQGLVYFPEFASKDPSAKKTFGKQETQQIDYFNDVLVLTAVSSFQPDGPELAGAKLPVSSIRFPFSFQMYEENLLISRPGVRAAWERAVNSEDILVKARICPSDSSSFPCKDIERKKYAEGVAKLITELPGLKEGEYIRAPASLALQ
jgi:hypothetical protein